MKKISNNLICCLTAVLLLVGCGEREEVVFDAVNGQTLVAFSRTTAELQIAIGATGTLELPVSVTTQSEIDRTFEVSVVAEESTASVTSYTVNPIVIPANSFIGSITIDGVDDMNITTTPEKLVLKITEVEGIVPGGNLEIDVLQICPVAETLFVGEYTVTTISPGVFGASTYGGNGNVVTLAIDESNPLGRTFTANYFEDGRFPRTFEFALVCNEVLVPFQDHLVGCGGNDVNLNTGPSTTGNGTYNVEDDSSFTIKLTDNVDSDCGGAPVQAEYLFTKN
ncbi:hypothetical protein [uncultured Polaribacter sp.]|uniref:hypothetical protein n=1 Tax=uncultured Polaribacter sp. TaxID=174711 RepID=UPI002623178E|nr:hypothetical protein [uncultured Polaribacter sp.]